jgi:hypothetical protein
MLRHIDMGSLIRRGVLAASAIVAAGVLAGCDPDRIIDVEDPDRLPPDFLGDSASLPVVRAGVIRDFIVAYSGTDAQEGQILQAGLLADELHSSGTFPTRQEVDARAMTAENGTNADVFRELSRARRSAERGAALFAEFTGDPVEHAEILALAGFTYIYFGENYCSGVPFSEFNEETDQFEFGNPLSTSEIFERALERFEEALPMAQGNDRILNLIRVGQGRALVNLGRFDEAAVAVAEVPTDFEYEVQHSSNTAAQNNGVWNWSNNLGRWSVADEQGIAFRTAFDNGDTRVPYYIAPSGPQRVGQRQAALRFQQMKYPTRESSIPVANGVEARLIEAEAALNNGQNGPWLATLNALRSNTSLYGCPEGALGCEDATLGSLSDPGNPDARAQLHFEERAKWLFLTSHRLGDMRRMIRQYGFAADDVFPSGPSSTVPGVNGPIVLNGGQPWGDQVSLVVPVDEENNPNYQGCDATIP